MCARRPFLIVLAVTALTLGAALEAQRRAIVLPEDIEFKAPFRPGGPAGATLYGDPDKPGLYVTRLKFAPGQQNMPHWHQDERTVVVLAGTYYFAYGEQWDESKLKAYPPGTFLTEPPKTAHFNWAKDGEVILQVTGYGPTSAVSIPQSR
ncbi:MAG: cupin domain-containing protein [Vicinamibacterales bacterium]